MTDPDQLPPEVREHVRRAVDAAPLLSPATRDRLAVLLRPVHRQAPTDTIPTDRKRIA